MTRQSTPAPISESLSTYKSSITTHRDGTSRLGAKDTGEESCSRAKKENVRSSMKIEINNGQFGG